MAQETKVLGIKKGFLEQEFGTVVSAELINAKITVLEEREKALNLLLETTDYEIKHWFPRVVLITSK
jgi:hypothetical protein